MKTTEQKINLQLMMITNSLKPINHLMVKPIQI